MARARNIKPGFFKNETLAECDPLARLLFAGLWCEADRDGRLEDRPKRLKAEYLPYDDADCDDLLDQLARSGFIRRYQVDGKSFICIEKFSKHQNPHCKEPASTIPAPCENSAETVPARLIPDSGFLIPDSCPDGQTRARVREEPAFDVLACPDTVNGEAWAQWVDHRRKRRKPISERAAAEQWRALACLSPPQQAACIAHSIRNDYQGLFPEKFGGANGNRDRSGGDPSADRSAAGRVRANAARELATLAAARTGRDDLAVDVVDVRPQVDFGIR